MLNYKNLKLGKLNLKLQVVQLKAISVNVGLQRKSLACLMKNSYAINVKCSLTLSLRLLLKKQVLNKKQQLVMLMQD